MASDDEARGERARNLGQPRPAQRARRRHARRRAARRAGHRRRPSTSSRSCCASRPATPASIVVDLRGLEFIDSTGIRLLVMAADRCNADGRLTILRGPKQVHRVFEITDLVSRLPFADA